MVWRAAPLQGEEKIRHPLRGRFSLDIRRGSVRRSARRGTEAGGGRGREGEGTGRARGARGTDADRAGGAGGANADRRSGRRAVALDGLHMKEGQGTPKGPRPAVLLAT